MGASACLDGSFHSLHANVTLDEPALTMTAPGIVDAIVQTRLLTCDDNSSIFVVRLLGLNDNAHDNHFMPDTWLSELYKAT